MQLALPPLGCISVGPQKGAGFWFWSPEIVWVQEAAWQETVLVYRCATFSYEKGLFFWFECLQIPMLQQGQANSLQNHGQQVQSMVVTGMKSIVSPTSLFMSVCNSFCSLCLSHSF